MAINVRDIKVDVSSFGFTSVYKALANHFQEFH